jgi:hypothetical protein
MLCALPGCVSLACATACQAGVPYVLWKLLVNVIGTPFYFCLRLLQYVHETERAAWIEYNKKVADAIQSTFGYRIESDLGLLHEPISMALQIYSEAFADTKRDGRKALDKLLAVAEVAEVRISQSTAASGSINQFLKCARAAKEKFKQMLEESWQQDDEQSKRLCAVPSALYAIDIGIKSKAQQILQTCTDTVQFKLVFSRCSTLLDGIREMRDAFEVAALINGFAHPTAMGMRAVSLLVKVPVDSVKCQDFFLVEVQLVLQRFEQAQFLASPHEAAFIELLPAVCRRIDPDDRPLVKELMCALMTLAVSQNSHWQFLILQVLHLPPPESTRAKTNIRQEHPIEYAPAQE